MTSYAVESSLEPQDPLTFPVKFPVKAAPQPFPASLRQLPTPTAVLQAPPAPGQPIPTSHLGGMMPPEVPIQVSQPQLQHISHMGVSEVNSQALHLAGEQIHQALSFPSHSSYSIPLQQGQSMMEDVNQYMGSAPHSTETADIIREFPMINATALPQSFIDAMQTDSSAAVGIGPNQVVSVPSSGQVVGGQEVPGSQVSSEVPTTSQPMEEFSATMLPHLQPDPAQQPAPVLPTDSAEGIALGQAAAEAIGAPPQPPIVQQQPPVSQAPQEQQVPVLPSSDPPTQAPEPPTSNPAPQMNEPVSTETPPQEAAPEEASKSAETEAADTTTTTTTADKPKDDKPKDDKPKDDKSEKKKKKGESSHPLKCDADAC